MVRVKSTPKKVDLAKLQAKKEAKKESGKKKGPKLSLGAPKELLRQSDIAIRHWTITGQISVVPDADLDGICSPNSQTLVRII